MLVEDDVVEARARPEAERHLLGDLDTVVTEQVPQRGRTAVVSRQVPVAGHHHPVRRLGHQPIEPYSAPVLRALDSRLLHAMRTRFHGPTGESVGKWLGRIGEYGAIWLVIGIVLAFTDPDNGEDWLVAGIL